MRAGGSERAFLFTLPPVKNWPDETLRAAYERFTFAVIRKRFE
jgi:hypothetical protein